MSTPSTPATPPRNPADQRLGPKRAATVIVFFAAWIAVVGGFYAWRGFSSPKKADLGTRLQDPSDPQKMQDATIELAARMKRHDPEAQRWYPTLLTMTNSGSTEIRSTAAWVMANDTTRDDFHQALLRLVRDPAPSVRATAAVSLAKFKDPVGRQTALAMLNSGDSNAQWESLRALRVIGTREDLEPISKFQSSSEARLRDAAKEAAQQIQDRIDSGQG